MQCPCGAELTGLKRKFCSNQCKHIQRNRPSVLTLCTDCASTYLVSPSEIQTQRRRKIQSRCHKCRAQRVPPPHPSGSDSPRWRGGHRHWSTGRYGRDKNGLSWKVQRRAAWERDAETCQHCKTKKTRKPDVHHVVPFRISQSHTLDNLLCLCQSCHLIEEAKVQEVWGAQCPRK